MIIREEQMKVFSAYMWRRFEDQMAAHLRRTFPELTFGMTDEDLLSTIRAGIQRAANYGVQREPDLQTFLEYVTCYGLNFDTNPDTNWAGQVLHDKTRNPSEKMYLLHQLRHERGGTQ